MRNFNKFLALVLALVMVMGGMVTVSAAEETAAVDYTVAANSLASLGIVKGTSDDIVDFNAEANVKRYEMALLMVRIMTGEVDDLYWNKVADNTTPFADVDEYYGAIAYVADNGIVKGVGDNKFNPDGQITFQDALTMAVRSLGYKQLDYPQGFINTAKSLGLTEGMADLANDKPLNRGETFQIIYNTLFATAKNGKSFAELNFGMTQEIYVVVATNLQAMAEATRVTKDGYVALAKMNADGTYDYSKYIHVTEDELGLAKDENVEMKLGYSYTVTSFESMPGEYSIVPNATKKLVSYGDDAKTVIANGTALNNVTASKYVKIDGVNYELVTSFSNLYNKSVSVGNNDKELIVYSMFGLGSTTTSAFQHYIYDGAGNIMNKEGTAVALYYIGGTYYKKLSGTGLTDGTFRVATEDDFAACAVVINSYNEQPMLGIVTNNAKLTGESLFYEITMMDDNNDGTYDRAIYIPYSVGYYTQRTFSSNATHYVVANSGTKSNTAAAPQINGVDLMFYATNTSGNYVSVGPQEKPDPNDSTKKVKVWDVKAYLQETDITFVGKKPANKDYIVYYYNPYARMMVVVENLGKAKTAAVTNFTTGTYTYYADIQGNKGYYYAGARVWLDDTPYYIGYRPGETFSQMVAVNTDTTIDTDLEYLNDSVARYGFDTCISEAAMNPTYARVSYVVLAGRIIEIAKASALTDGNDWMAFDYGWSTKSTSGIYTTYNYKGDIVGVDENTGFIQALAYLPADGVQTLVDIETINGYNYGLLVADYAALQYQYSGIGILQANAYETMKKIVVKDFFKTLTADLNGENYNYVDESQNQRQLFYIVTGKDAETGAYQLYTDVEEYWGTRNVNTYRQPAEVNYSTSNGTVNFVYGVSTKAVYAANGVAHNKTSVLTQNANSVVLVIAKNGIYQHTGLLHNESIVFPSYNNNDSASVYKLTNDYIVIVDKNRTIADIMPQTDFNEVITSGYNYYMVIGNAMEDKAFDEQSDGRNTQVSVMGVENGQKAYYYTNLYCLNTGTTVTSAIKVLGGLEMFNADENITSWGKNAVKPIGAVYAEKNGEWTLLNGESIVDIATTTQAGVLGTVKVADGIMEFLDRLFLTGVTVDGVKYDGLYSGKYLIAGAAPHTSQLNTTNGLISERADFTFTAAVLNFYAPTGDGKSNNVEAIWPQAAQASSSTNYGKGHAVYCDYVPGAYFAGTVLRLDTRVSGNTNLWLGAQTTVAKNFLAKLDYANALSTADAALACNCTETVKTLGDHVTAVFKTIDDATKAGTVYDITSDLTWFENHIKTIKAN